MPTNLVAAQRIKITYLFITKTSRRANEPLFIKITLAASLGFTIRA